MLTVYAEAELNCDGAPCLDPLANMHGSPSAEIHTTARTLAAARREVIAAARRIGWERRGDRWLCPFCSRETPI